MFSEIARAIKKTFECFDTSTLEKLKQLIQNHPQAAMAAVAGSLVLSRTLLTSGKTSTPSNGQERRVRSRCKQLTCTRLRLETRDK